MARESYDVSIKCPNCTQLGRLSVSENDYEFMRRSDRSVVCNEGRFDTEITGSKEVRVVCTECDHEFHW